MKQLAWALMFAVAALPGQADADCGIPRWIGAADASALPVTGSVYVHHEMMGYRRERMPEPAFRWTGAASTLSITKVSDVVVRVDYDAPYAFGAEILADQEDDYDLPRVTFDPQWAAPATAPRVVQYWHDISSWTCSATDSVNIQLDQPIAAARMRWTYGGETREWIEVPRSVEPTKSVLELGKFNCGSTTVDPAELAEGGHLELIAIRHDRSEVAVTGLPVRLSTKEMPADESDRTMHLATMLPAEKPAPVAKAAPPAPPSPTAAYLALGIFALAGVLAVRTRVRAPQ